MQTTTGPMPSQRLVTIICQIETNSTNIMEAETHIEALNCANHVGIVPCTKAITMSLG
jgi:hypothetical protein